MREQYEGSVKDTAVEIAPVPSEDATGQRIIEVRGLGKEYSRNKRVIDNINLAITQGQVVSIVGPSGSGKTTFLRCLNLLVEPSCGELLYRGMQIGRWPDAAPRRKVVISHRAKLGFVFQHFELFPHLTALQNITLGPRRVLDVPRSVAEERARELLNRVGLLEFANVRPRALSGGQQQRVAIARALAMQPDVLLLDEPTSALDTEMVDEVLDIIAELADEGITMLIVTHELSFARRVSDRIVVFDKGQICEEGPAARVFEQPAKSRTREILGGSRRTW